MTNPTKFAKLGLMMFMQYLLLAVWWVPMAAYLTNISATALQKSLILSSMAIGSNASPIFGAIADRMFSAQKVLAVSNIITAVLLVFAASTSNTTLLFVCVLVAMIFYMPTWALTSTISLKHSAAEDFPRIRMFGTLGWIAAGAFSLVAINIFDIQSFDGSSLPLLCGAGVAVVTALINLTLPNTPPSCSKEKFKLSEVFGLKAFAMLKDRNYAVFMATAVMAIIPFALFYNFGAEFLQNKDFQYITVTMSIGQVAEAFFLLLATYIMKKAGMKFALALGLIAMIARYGMLWAGVELDSNALYIGGILVHGLIFGLFFVGGQVYTDKKAPADLRAAAQGFLSLMVWGVGLLIGTLFCGDLINDFRPEPNVYDWSSIFGITTGLSAFVLLFFVLFFKKESSGNVVKNNS
ncbi:MAG: MFS transporter [Rikenellaceae bacterium]